MLFAVAATPPEGLNPIIPFAKYQNLYRHIIKLVMDPAHYGYYSRNCDSDICLPLEDTLKQLDVSDVYLKDLQKRSGDLVTAEKHSGHYRHKLDNLVRHSMEKPNSIDGGDSEINYYAKQLPVPIQDLSRQIVKLQEHSIARGGFCDVYLGEGTIAGQVERVAMKLLRVNSKQSKVTRAFYREVEHWVRVRHPFVLPFYGISEMDGQLYMISPWAEYGNAIQYLQAHPNANRRKLVSAFSLHLKISFSPAYQLWETSDALMYLHSGAEIPPMVHGDIKAVSICKPDCGTWLTVVPRRIFSFRVRLNLHFHLANN